MKFEATTLTTAARLIAETLEEHYAMDARPIFAGAGLDYTQLLITGARYPWKGMQKLWVGAVEASGDPCFGLYVGQRIRPVSFHALGYSWLASETLLGSLNRLCRYLKVISTTPVSLSLEPIGKTYVLTDTLRDPTHVLNDAAIDAVVVAIVQLCRIATDAHFSPVSVALERADPGNAAAYVAILGCPVSFGADASKIVFDRASLESRLPGDNEEIARANDKVVEQYLRRLESNKVAFEVRELLIGLLPSGEFSQTRIADRMHRGLSTLRRQLRNEGTSYKDILDDTRSSLAREYIRDPDLTLSQVAYILGFSDQSNFTRAFKRWTGMTPREYRLQAEI